MYLSNWQYFVNDEIDRDEDEYASDIFLDNVDLAEFKVNGKAALLYCIGPTDHHINARIIRQGEDRVSGMVVMSQSWYYASKYAKAVGDISYMSISANSCADTMYATHQARMLIENEGFDEVVVVAEEIINKSTSLLFKQLGIDVKLGDGFVIAKLTKAETRVKVLDTAWEFKLGNSPMSFDKDGYMKVVNKLEKWEPEYVKTHGTGTPSNTEAEDYVLKYLEAKEIRFKDKIGHTQGVSALLEMCMCVDSGYTGKILGLASGAGGFYGGCVIEVCDDKKSQN